MIRAERPSYAPGIRTSRLPDMIALSFFRTLIGPIPPLHFVLLSGLAERLLLLENNSPGKAPKEELPNQERQAVAPLRMTDTRHEDNSEAPNRPHARADNCAMSGSRQPISFHEPRQRHDGRNHRRPRRLRFP